MATYEELAKDVVQWANRDTEVLTYARVRQCISFAMDEALRTLRIVPMEKTVSSTIPETGSTDNKILIPQDTVEFIQLRRIANGPFGRSIPSDRYDVAEARMDVRSYYGDNVTAYSDYAYSREGDNLLIWPRLQGGDIWELYYYARFPEAHERVSINSINAAAGFIETINDTDLALLAITDPEDPTAMTIEPRFDVKESEDLSAVTDWDGDSAYVVDDLVIYERVPYIVTVAVEAPSGDILNDPPSEDTDNFSTEVPFTNLTIALIAGETLIAGDGVLNLIGELDDNWLRDENEKVLLFGALHQAFDYLDEPDQSDKFKAKFEQEIQKLNTEDTMRTALGGNANINFYNRLI